MFLKAYLVSATDGRFVLGADELPELRALSKTIEGAAGAVAVEAARLTGDRAEDFEVEILY